MLLEDFLTEFVRNILSKEYEIPMNISLCSAPLLQNITIFLGLEEESEDDFVLSVSDLVSPSLLARYSPLLFFSSVFTFTF